MPTSGKNLAPTAADIAAVAELRRRDARLAAIIDRVGEFRVNVTRDPFAALVASIIHQQLSMTAAATIERRVRELCPRKRVTHDALLAQSTPKLRAAGLSGQKVLYLRDLCAHFADGRITAAKLRRMDDEAVIESTTDIHGVGRWTAEMLLIFCLRRPDVWPIDDLGIRKAVQKLLGAEKTPDKATLQQTGEAWRPYRTYASWYLWRSLSQPGGGI